MSVSRNFLSLLIRTSVCLVALVIFAGADCDSGVPGGSSYGDDGWYNYGWTEVGEDGSTSSFNLYPGSDPGESLETYLSDSVIYN